jgi:hypothetical protein
MRLFHCSIISAFVLTVTACSSAYVVRCREGDQVAVHDALYFGTAKPDGVVSSEDWARFLNNTVTPLFPHGLISTTAAGQWLSADGEIVRENAHVLQILHPDNEASAKAIRAVMDGYKSQFKQEAVLRLRTHMCASF